LEFENPFYVQVVGDTAINHYRIRFMGRNLDGCEMDETIHVTHIWIKESSQWKLIAPSNNHLKSDTAKAAPLIVSYGKSKNKQISNNWRSL
jgi:ketosteroid isomerase-like protein